MIQFLRNASTPGHQTPCEQSSIKGLSFALFCPLVEAIGYREKIIKLKSTGDNFRSDGTTVIPAGGGPQCGRNGGFG